MEMLPNFYFKIKINGSQRFTRKIRKLFMFYDRISTTIDSNAFHGSCGLLHSDKIRKSFDVSNGFTNQAN